MNYFSYRHYILLFVCMLLNLGGCTSLNYYSQSIIGQLEIIQKQRAIKEVRSDPSLESSIKKRLETVLEIRYFASEQLQLPDNNSYRGYADLDREYVVWNVFATEEFSLKPQEWCFLFVGCLQYRGYFSEKEARSFAEQLKLHGMDVYLGGVSAYSTLGWFDDPVLNTMLKWSDARLAAVIFHELTHQLLYIKDDTEFNEALADTIAMIGVRRWLLSSHRDIELREYETFLGREESFVRLIMKYKTLLEKLYTSDKNTVYKRAKKNEFINMMRVEYQELQNGWDKDYFGTWINNHLNNASLSSVISYRKFVPAFLHLYESTEHNLPVFYDKVKILTWCEKSKRTSILTNKITDINCPG